MNECLYIFGEIRIIVIIVWINKLIVDMWVRIDILVYVFDICIKMFS